MWKVLFLSGYIDEEVYVSQTPGFEDHRHLDHVYKLQKALLAMQGEFEMSMMGELNFFPSLQVKQVKQMKNGRFFCQSKYCKELLKKFEMDKFKEATTPIDFL